MIAAVTMVKDEADVVEFTVGRMLAEVDFVIVADNGSTDGTLEILERLRRDSGKLAGNLRRLIVRDDDEPGYFQSAKMSALAASAGEHGAEWVVPFDADEVWRSPDGRRIAEVLAGRPEAVIAATLINHYATAEDPDVADPIERMGYRHRDPLPLPKVAVRPSLPVTIEQGNHGAHYEITGRETLLEIRHYPYRSAEQFVRKARNGAAAYAATDLPEHVGQHWREYGRLVAESGEDAGVEWFRRHFFYPAPLAPGSELFYDPCPPPAS